MPRYISIHCHAEEFCVGAISDKIVVKAYN